MVVGHTADFHLKVLVSQLPPDFAQQQVNVIVPRFGFGVVVCVWLDRIGGFDRCHFIAQGFQFSIQRGFVRQQGSDFGIPLFKLAFQRLQLGHGLGRQCRRRGGSGQVVQA